MQPGRAGHQARKLPSLVLAILTVNLMVFLPVLALSAFPHPWEVLLSGVRLSMRDVVRFASLSCASILEIRRQGVQLVLMLLILRDLRLLELGKILTGDAQRQR